MTYPAWEIARYVTNDISELEDATNPREDINRLHTKDKENRMAQQWNRTFTSLENIFCLEFHT